MENSSHSTVPCDKIKLSTKACRTSGYVSLVKRDSSLIRDNLGISKEATNKCAWLFLFLARETSSLLCPQCELADNVPAIIPSTLGNN